VGRWQLGRYYVGALGSPRCVIMHGVMVGLLPDTGGISLLLVAGALMLGLGVLIYALLRRRM
jgi:LPXTG-motif cell wall-anchored protein